MRCSTLRGGYHTGRVLHGGRTLVDSAALCFAAPLLDLRPRSQSCVRRDPRGPYNQGAKRLKNKPSLDPLDLDAGSPVTSRSIRFGHTTELPLMGFSKDRPSIVPSRGVRRPGLAFPLRPSEVSCRPPRVPSTWFCTTPTDSPPRPRRFVSPCCRSWGSPRFSSSRNEDPRGVFLPFEVFPPLTAFAPALVRGVSPLLTISSIDCHDERERHRSSCPPALSLRDVVMLPLSRLHGRLRSQFPTAVSRG